jgi:hypothetical protein
MRNTTKFVSQFLELKRIHNIFFQHFFFQKKIKIEFPIILFCLTGRPASSSGPLPKTASAARAEETSGPARWRGPLALRPKKDREEGAGHGRDAGARDVAAERCLPAANGQLRPSGDWRSGAQGSRKDGHHQSAARGGQERARTPEGRNERAVAGNGGAVGRAIWRLTGGGGGVRRCVQRRGGDGGA